MDNIITIDHLYFEYRREEEGVVVPAVRDVSLSVERGSFTAVIGRNGSGKSTLAKCTNALLLPSGGAVYVDGMDTRDEKSVWQIRQTAGMVFQNPDNQLVSSIVEDDVAFGPENLGVEPSEIRKRVDESLYSVKMYEERRKAPHLLSGGQKQRVAIAGVVAMRPRCIVFDEPTAMLDPHGRSEVMEIIEQLHNEGITVVLITHFMEEAARADNVIIMDRGIVAMEGTPEEVFSRAAEIRKLNLDVPFAVDMAQRLRVAGMSVPKEIIREDQLADYLIQNREKFNIKGFTAPEREENDREDDIILEVKDLKHIYSEGLPYETVALEDVSFRVQKGSFVGIIGHTGSGKSSLVQHLNGLLKAKSGTISVDGMDFASPDVKMRDIRKRIGLVFQYPEYQLFEETVERDVAFGPRNLGLSEEDISRRVRMALELVGLEYDEVAARSPFDLSGGQKRRVAIAGVLAMYPDVLILDEPTAGLDPRAHRDVLNMIRNVHDMRGTTILLVSHNMGDVAELADQVLVMDRGRLAIKGTPEYVFSQSERLHGLGLALPPAEEFLCALRERGAQIEQMALNADQAQEAVCRWLAK